MSRDVVASCGASRFERMVVIDVETTGLLNSDRIVEVAAVVLDDCGQIVDEYDTLVDPQRDVGPTDIHGITASMVSAAPTFRDIAAALGSRLHGAVLVAHNLPFDLRMLANEFHRLGARLLSGQGICTLKATGERLNLACERFGVALQAHHRALADARATSQLLLRILDDVPERRPAALTGLDGPLNPRTLRREAMTTVDAMPLARIVATTRYPKTDGSLLSYLDALDWALDDLVITSVEAEQLHRLTEELGLRRNEVERVHRQYLEMLIASARRDGIITSEEHKLMKTVASALGIEDMEIPSMTPEPEAPKSIRPGTRVCFTGTATGRDGQKIERDFLYRSASNLGLRPVKGVTRKNCDLLVAADAASSSAKACKAREYGIPIMSILDFCDSVGIGGSGSLTDCEEAAQSVSNGRPIEFYMGDSQICFTGFSPGEKRELSLIAKDKGLDVVKSVTKNLSFLCTGPNPGPAKLRKAQNQDAIILNRDEFTRMLETGEVP